MDMTDFTQNLADAVISVREKRQRYMAYSDWGITARKEPDMTESPEMCECGCGTRELCQCTATNNCGCTCWET